MVTKNIYFFFKKKVFCKNYGYRSNSSLGSQIKKSSYLRLCLIRTSSLPMPKPDNWVSPRWEKRTWKKILTVIKLKFQLAITGSCRGRNRKGWNEKGRGSLPFGVPQWEVRLLASASTASVPSNNWFTLKKETSNRILHVHLSAASWAAHLLSAAVLWRPAVGQGHVLACVHSSAIVNEACNQTRRKDWLCI